MKNRFNGDYDLIDEWMETKKNEENSLNSLKFNGMSTFKDAKKKRE